MQPIFTWILNTVCCVELFCYLIWEYINLLQWLCHEDNLRYLCANNPLQYYSPLCHSADCQAAVKPDIFPSIIRQHVVMATTETETSIFHDKLSYIWDCDPVWFGGILPCERKKNHPADVNPWCSRCVVTVLHTCSYFRIFPMWLTSLNCAETMWCMKALCSPSSVFK